MYVTSVMDGWSNEGQIGYRFLDEFGFSIFRALKLNDKVTDKICRPN